ncbi:MAG: flavin reductase [Candidatus Poseidoniaceae archaeon]|jgi:flavin reductase (DIM6/NTAB) family NADH-FMN oxidoreductase RutF|nr:flavin reductase [Candidatus Poseidoniaceae archaeon]
MNEEKSTVIDFLKKCVAYSDASILRKRERGELEEIPRWQAYRDFTAFSIAEIEQGNLDEWFLGGIIEPSSKSQETVEMAELEPAALEYQHRAMLLDGLVGPRPVFVAATRSDDGIHNLSLLSTVTVASNSPALLTCSLSQDLNGRPRDTLLNLRENGSITLHLLPATLEATAMAEAAANPLPREDSEWDLIGSKPPLLPGAIASLQCELVDEHILPEAVATLCVFALKSVRVPEKLGKALLNGGRTETLYQHGWCHLHPSDDDWSHLIH